MYSLNLLIGSQKTPLNTLLTFLLSFSRSWSYRVNTTSLSTSFSEITILTTECMTAYKKKKKNHTLIHHGIKKVENESIIRIMYRTYRSHTYIIVYDDFCIEEFQKPIAESILIIRPISQRELVICLFYRRLYS